MSAKEAPVTIRPATRDDLPAILAIYNEAVLNTTASYDLEPSTPEQRAAWFAARERQGFPVLVAEVGGAVAAFGSYGTFREKPGYRHTVEHTLYVAPGWRRHGLGRALLAELVALARAAGKHAMVGGVDAENAGSLRFHLAMGFVEVARFREVGHKFGRWLDIIFVELLLDR
ncbi:MAG TPA: N-acetyltransferase family protein [Chloroflexaceae bacterium]|nr:N-acetyltransferase family protein [Chloroflexaceae bacterium]